MSEQTPPRMYIVHLKTGVTITAQFNPVLVEESVAAAYKRLAILGLSYRPMQYLGTDNIKIKMALTFDAASSRLVTTAAGTNAAFKAAGIPFGATRGIRTELPRRFLLACHYPSRGANNVATGAPSKLLFVWPKTYSIACRITKLANGMSRFDQKSQQTLMTSNIELEVAFVKRPTFESVFELGLLQHSTGTEG